MAGFPPARGGGSPFLSLIAGLGPLMQGFMQGRGFVDQEKIQKQELQDQQTKSAADLLPLYAQMSQTSPEMRGNPQFIAGLNKNLSPLGVNFQGQVPPTFGSVDPSQLLTNPSFMTWYSAQPRESQQALSQKFGGALPVGEPIDSSPTAQWHFDQMVSQNLNNLGKGEGLNTSAYVNWIKTTAPRYGRDPNQYLSDPATLGQLSQVSAAKIDDMVSSGYLKKSTADALKAKLPYQIRQMISGTNLNAAKTNAIPVQLQQAQARIDNEGKRLDLAAQGLEARWAQIQTGQQNANAHTIQVAEKTYDDTIKQWQADQRIREGYTGQLNAYVASKSSVAGWDITTDPNIQSYKARIDELTARINNEHKHIAGFDQQRQQMRNTSIHNSGAPSNMRVTNTPAGHLPTPAGLMNGKPIFLKTDKSGYVFADGTPAQ